MRIRFLNEDGLSVPCALPRFLIKPPVVLQVYFGEGQRQGSQQGTADGARDPKRDHNFDNHPETR